MSRRSKLTPAVQTKILQAIQAGATYEYAATFAGICRTTLYSWMQKGQEQKRGAFRTFLNEFKKAEAMACIEALAVIKKEARGGNWHCAAWLLERRFGYTKDGPPPVQITIDVDAIDSKTLIAEYEREIQKLIKGPVIDLDEE